jgi:hypothetical protein
MGVSTLDVTPKEALVLRRQYTTFLLLCLRWLQRLLLPTPPLQRPTLDLLWALDEGHLPLLVRECPVTMQYLHLLGELDWSRFPERARNRAWPGPQPQKRAPFVAAFLIKLNENKPCMSGLRSFLVNHPGLIWLLGFPLAPSPKSPWGFDPEKSLPCRQHFSRILRTLQPDQVRFLLAASVALVGSELDDVTRSDNLSPFGDEISLDTKHILAWVRENNPKEFIPHRFDKHNQPKGDPDCKLGCKKRRNLPTHDGTNTTPTQEGMPAGSIEVGDYYWGYASGVVATKVGDWGEVVLAERTQTFDQGDQTFFFPLMHQTQQHLGRRPTFGAFDAAFDAFYVYDYFHDAGGFAAVPYAGRKDHRKQFDAQGLPLCAAGLAMPLRSTFHKKSLCLVPHQCGRYGCPLSLDESGRLACPIHHPNWAKGGCSTTLATSPGARIRHQLDRHSEQYQRLYRQRTATERINAQAKELGIERPRLRNACSIANQNTLIYVLINMRTLHRIRTRKAQRR